MTEVRLRPLEADEFPAWRATFVAGWAEDLRATTGAGEDAARRLAEAGTDAALPQGPATPGQLLLAIVAGERDVGALWLSLGDAGHAHISDIAVDAPHRGRGVGRRALELAEDEARRAGATTIGLNVFAHNPRARALYERLGFRQVSTAMAKRLD